MNRVIRSMWSDRSLVLLLVPVALLITALVVNRAESREVEATSATASTTTVVAERPDGEVASTPSSAEVAGAVQEPTFDGGGRTVVDDDGNLLRVPNDAPVTGGVAPSNQTASADAPPQAVGAPSEPAASPTSTVPVDTRPPAETATTTLPTTTLPTTTLPTDPAPVVAESPVAVLLPVSGVAVVGVGWVLVSHRRRRTRERVADPGAQR